MVFNSSRAKGMMDVAHQITHVEPGSIAAKHGICAGDALKSINHEPIIDQIDYQALSARRKLSIEIEKPDGQIRTIELLKPEYAPLGMQLEETLVSKPRSCRNKCIFCFIDQMPPGLRNTLYVKDDDWRLSLMMGNYITLTNVSPQEMDRIIRRRASPLYISVHATDGQVRMAMMSNPSAVQIMNHLRRFKDNHIQFHCQVVLCPGWNDGPVLVKTLNDLACLAPAAQSVALVPVGLTGFREGLMPIQPYTLKTARELVEMVRPFQEKYKQTLGTRFVFPSDEFYCLSGLPLPQAEEYEDFPQIENGVGLLCLFKQQVDEAWQDNLSPLAHDKHTVIACGVSVAPFIKQLCDTYAPRRADITVVPIQNDFFGRTITVTGLITGGDLVKQLNHVQTDRILICDSMLRREGDLFLDDMTLEEAAARLPAPLQVVQNTGAAFYNAICGLEG